ncbi:hypothetical protein BaRGS_00004159, partial [Batillaria attramentaria]
APLPASGLLRQVAASSHSPDDDVAARGSHSPEGEATLRRRHLNRFHMSERDRLFPLSGGLIDACPPGKDGSFCGGAFSCNFTAIDFSEFCSPERERHVPESGRERILGDFLKPSSQKQADCGPSVRFPAWESCLVVKDGLVTGDEVL